MASDDSSFASIIDENGRRVVVRCDGSRGMGLWSVSVWFILTWLFLPVVFFILLSVWLDAAKHTPAWAADALKTCADQGNIHEGAPFGACSDLKRIVDGGIDYERIVDDVAIIVASSGDGSTERGPGPQRRPTGFPQGEPLVRAGVEFKVADSEFGCPGIEEIEIKDKTVTITRPKLDLPNFCKPGSEASGSKTVEWELLERPRQYVARTWEHFPVQNKDEPELAGGAYVVFIAKKLDGVCCEPDRSGGARKVPVRDKRRVTIFIAYVDYVTGEPNIVELNIEVLRGKDVISPEDTIQLVSNVKLDSLNKQVLFQVGEGAGRLVIAGYDFGARSTAGDPGLRRRSDEDTSGSYVVQLDHTGSVADVFRRDFMNGAPARERRRNRGRG